MRKIAKFIVEKRVLFFVLFAALLVYSAFGIPKVVVEYDITTYLPAGTDTKRALEIMDGEFAAYGSATLIVKTDLENAVELHDEIAALDGVKNFPFGEGEEYYKDGTAKFGITFVGTDDDAAAVAAYKKTLEILESGGYDYSVPTPLIDDYAERLAGEMIVIIAISAAVILLVLLFTSKSFAEILAFPIVFVVAAALNMGTNHWFGKISFVSNTVCIILQLALAIDYAIILCHRSTEEKDKRQGDPKGAMTAALAKAIPEIASSSLNTVSGLVALMFMQLRLGLDLGAVLAKSIVCSLLTVFLLMPGVLLLLSKPMDRTRHRNFVPKLRFWGKGVIKARYVLIPVFVALFAVGAALSQRLAYCYSTDAIDTSRPTDTMTAKRECEEIFGYDNMFVVLVPTGDAELERGILAAVAEEPLVDSALGLAGVEIADGLYVTDSVDYKTFAQVTGVNEGMSMILFMRYAAAAGESFSLGYKAPILGLADYLLANIDGLPLSDEQKAAARELAETLDFARGQLVGKNYSRLVFNIAAPTESKQTFELIERLGPKIKAMCADAIFAGASMSAYDLNSSFSSDNIMISLLTVLFIYLILAVTFRSPLIPAVLVLVIQGAIFLNFSLPVVMGNNLFFFTYLIVSAIQMGATIDYAILITNRYRSLAAHTDSRTAIVDAVAGAFPTVFTSGSIMSVAGFLVGGLTSDPLIASMGTCLGTGTIISMIGVMVFLPVLLYMLAPVLEKTVVKFKPSIRRMRLDDPSAIPYYNKEQD